MVQPLILKLRDSCASKQFLLEDSIQIPLNNLAFPAHEPTFYNSQFIPVIDLSSYLMGIVQSKDLRKAITQNVEFISVFSSTKALAVLPTITVDELMQLIENDSSYYQSNILVVDTRGKLLGYILPNLIRIITSLRFSSLFFHAVDNIKEGLIIIDKDSHAVYLNSRYNEIVGVPTYKVLGRPLNEIEPQSLILKTLATGESYSNQPVKIQSVNKDVVVNISPVRAGNEIIGACFSFPGHYRNRSTSEQTKPISKIGPAIICKYSAKYFSCTFTCFPKHSRKPSRFPPLPAPGKPSSHNGCICFTHRRERYGKGIIGTCCPPGEFKMFRPIHRSKLCFSP